MKISTRRSTIEPATAPPIMPPLLLFPLPELVCSCSVGLGGGLDDELVVEEEDCADDEGRELKELESVGAAVASAPIPVSRSETVADGVPVTCFADARKSLNSWMEGGFITLRTLTNLIGI
jgi:hypothetical protein